MYKFEHATQEELEKLREWIDRHPQLSRHTEADLEWWITGHWPIESAPPEFYSLEDMLHHLDDHEQTRKPKKTP